MRRLLAVAALAPVPALAAEPASLERRIDDATIDWAGPTLRVVGAGTPRILSPTASLLEDDASVLALASARSLARRALAAMPLGSGATVATEPRLAQGLARLDAHLRPGPPRPFSDGTIHLVATLDLHALFGLADRGPGPALRLAAPPGFEPCLEVRLVRGDSGAALLAGLPGDAVPALRYTAPQADGGPATTVASPAACTLALPADAPPTLVTPATLEIVLP